MPGVLSCVPDATCDYRGVNELVILWSAVFRTCELYRTFLRELRRGQGGSRVSDIGTEGDSKTIYTAYLQAYSHWVVLKGKREVF